MIYDALDLPNMSLRVDVCVIGSGAGGLTAAMVLAESGLRVAVLEQGGFITPDDMTQREDTMLARLYQDSASRTSVDRRVHIHQGKGVGGSTLHNLNLCKRIPDLLLDQWHRERQLSHLPPSRWLQLYREVEDLLSVTPVAPELYNAHNRLLLDGASKLGWRAGGLAHNRSGCVGSGFCELGCAFDAKNNAAKVMLPRFVDAGGIVLCHTQAVRILHKGGQVVGVQAAVVDDRGEVRHRQRIDASRVVVAASATATAALLLRSELADASGLTGKTLRVHPAVVAAGDFEQPVRAWAGIPQTVECTEFLRFGADRGQPGAPTRVWIVPAFGHPMGVATMMPGFGAQHADVMGRYAHLAVLCAMLHDETLGTVEPDGDLGLRIDYRPSDADVGELSAGWERLCQLLFAAGARRVLLPQPEPMVLRSAAELGRVASADVRLSGLTAVHPMASVPMSDDPRLGPVDSQGRHHGVAGLWVADGSLFPTSIGGPPQLSIYALGLHVGRAAAPG